MAPLTEPPRPLAGRADLFAMVMDGLADGLTVHQAEGHFEYVSRSFARLTGFAAEELIGRSPFDLAMFHPEDVDRVVEVQADALASGRPWRVQYRLRRADGAFTWVESTGRAVTGPDGDRFVVSTRGADHRESLVEGMEVERRLERGHGELAARQQRFLTTVSHRARTPLTSVIGIIELLRQRDGELADDQRTLLLERLDVNAQRLRELLEEVTQADRLSRADVLLERRLVDLHRIAAEVIGDVAVGQSEISNAVPQGLRAVVDGDRVHRLLRILLANGCKHAGVGAAVVVRAWARGRGVELVVEDDGPGVPPELREQVFRPFVHADTDSPDPGSGLGLYIVSELAALHGGRAWVDARPGGGARFHVLLPGPGCVQTSASGGSLDAA